MSWQTLKTKIIVNSYSLNIKSTFFNPSFMRDLSLEQENVFRNK